MRTDAQKNYEIKLDNILGMNYQTARGQLERQFILHLAKKCNMNNCFQCGYPIDSAQDMTLEHKEPWGGNKDRGLEGSSKLFWDLENLALSHGWCNYSAGPLGKGEFKYRGIHRVTDNRKSPPAVYIRGMIKVGEDQKTLGCYDTQEEAGISYDIGIMVVRKGVGKLNFPNFREQYSEHLKRYATDRPEFFDIRRGPIKSIVSHFYTLLNKAAN